MFRFWEIWEWCNIRSPANVLWNWNRLNKLPLSSTYIDYWYFQAAWWFVCLFVSLLSHFWLIHLFSPTPAFSTISRTLSSSMCSIIPETANVGSSYNHMRGPGIGCWVSDRSNCSHRSLTLTLTLTSEKLWLYTTLILLLVLIQLSWLQLLSYKL